MIERELEKVLEENFRAVSKAIEEVEDVLAGELGREEMVWRMLIRGVIPRSFVVDILYRDRMGKGVKLSKVTRRYFERLVSRKTRRLFGSKHRKKKDHYTVRRKKIRYRKRKFVSLLYEKKLESIVRYLWSNNISKILPKNVLNEVSKEKSIKSITYNLLDVQNDIRRAIKNKVLRLEKYLDLDNKSYFISFIDLSTGCIISTIRLDSI